MERTYVMIKPDGVQRNLVGKIISKFEDKGLKLVGMKFMLFTREMAERHYKEHVGKKFYEKLLDYIISGPVVAMVWEGTSAVAVARKLMGITRPLEADPSSIRGAYGMDVGRNVIHGADSPESAEREISFYFKEEELIEYDRMVDPWIYE